MPYFQQSGGGEDEPGEAYSEGEELGSDDYALSVKSVGCPSTCKSNYDHGDLEAKQYGPEHEAGTGHLVCDPGYNNLLHQRPGQGSEDSQAVPSEVPAG